MRPYPTMRHYGKNGDDDDDDDDDDVVSNFLEMCQLISNDRKRTYTQ